MHSPKKNAVMDAVSATPWKVQELTGRVVRGDNAKVRGSNNTVLGCHVKVWGDDNTIRGDYAYAVGSRNRILGDFATMVGEDNDAGAGFCPVILSGGSVGTGKFRGADGTVTTGDRAAIQLRARVAEVMIERTELARNFAEIRGGIISYSPQPDDLFSRVYVILAVSNDLYKIAARLDEMKSSGDNNNEASDGRVRDYHNGLTRVWAEQVRCEVHAAQVTREAKERIASSATAHGSGTVKATVDADADEDDSKACFVCFNAQRSVAFQPCGHIPCCVACAEKVMGSTTALCPVCRSAVEASARVYI